jgi:carboxymethylenebutenolidase
MCFDDDSHPPIPVSLHSGAHGEDIRLTAADGASIAAHLASPGDPPTAQVIVLPDARGLHQFYKDLALRSITLLAAQRMMTAPSPSTTWRTSSR